ncbi:little elongation complex subunit 2 [Denticeps clupeoides]|uniref:Little elongation complex subunit 2 C-terminal domain-containing protein n=1 Tax=Denticeps clupeoides TaxID=299321 RepID=A0AAY4E969_9TELE|nr:little elongation complex subunit 2 [Denticeps clupeoides]
MDWKKPPVPDGAFFSREVYEKYSLALNVKELWNKVQSRRAKAEQKEQTSEVIETSIIQNSGGLDTAQQKTASKESSPTKQLNDESDNISMKKRKKHPVDQFPEPRVPYRCFSTLNMKERQFYLHWLQDRSKNPPSRFLLDQVGKEVSEFMWYLQDVSRICAEDYNHLPPGAVQYSEDFQKSCLKHVMKYPQVYSIHESTSLVRGNFLPEVSWFSEKQVLAMGKVDMVGHKMLTEDAQLAVDYEGVSLIIPPDKKAAKLHEDISSDPNAEKLSGRYQPHVCLSKEAFLQLLDNGPEFTEAWELPMCVKINHSTGSEQSKTVYIDSPLPRKEITQRQKSHLFHEESVKLLFKKRDSKMVFFVMADKHIEEVESPPKGGATRSLISFEDTGAEFDLTDLESFGESSSSSMKKTSVDASSSGSASVKPKVPHPKPSSPKPITKTENDEEASSKDNSFSKAPEADSSWTDVDDSAVEGSSEADSSVQIEEEPINSSVKPQENQKDHSKHASDPPPAKRRRKASGQDSDSDVSADSDEMRLFIADMPSPPMAESEQVPSHVRTPPAAPSVLPDVQTSVPDTTAEQPGPSPGIRKTVRRPRQPGHCDQLGQILRMQSAMLKQNTRKIQEPLRPPEPKPATAPQGTTSHGNPLSLVKPCVSSYLETRQNEDGENPAAVTFTGFTSVSQRGQKKRLLTEDLLGSTEDEGDYDAPEEGNTFYKLYSLDDLLIMVRSSIPLAHGSSVSSGSHCAVPVYVLPKLEYQLCYGAECLTPSEVCKLWAEKLLHSNTVLYLARINALTSKLAQLQELQSDWMQNLSCDFQPTRLLNILQHVLKKLTGLPEGRYLLSHKARDGHVSILKASDGKSAGRSTYDLQLAYAQPPTAQNTVPWVPVDPGHVLPFHVKFCRLPCTFPPRDQQQWKQAGGVKAGGRGAGRGRGRGAAQRPGPAQHNQNQPGKKKKKNKGKRLKRKEVWEAKKKEKAAEQSANQNQGTRSSKNQ